MNLEQYKGVFIYAQQVDNKIDAIALELLGKANDLAADLGTDVTAVLIGSDVKGLVDEHMHWHLLSTNTNRTFFWLEQQQSVVT